MGDGDLRFSALGRLTAWRAGQEIELGWAKQQAVLATLLINLNRPVSVARIVDAVWGESPPRDARNAVQTNISRLRRVLESPGNTKNSPFLRSTMGGYLLCGDPDKVDIAMFDRHFDAARAHHSHGELQGAATEIDLALALWRGEPFSGLPGPLIDTERQRLHQRHLDAVELRASIMLDRGRHVEAVADLTRLVNDYPLQERFRALLMLAHYRSERQAEALNVFQDLRQRLADEVGIDPGRELSELHQQILRADPAVAAPPDSDRRPVRNDLPGDVTDFTGRTAELAQLLTGRTRTSEAATTAVVIHSIDGMAGIGKTTLAVHAAHHLAPHYPDAQLFIDLHGHTSNHRPLTPMAALDSLLRALGVPADKIPNEVDPRSALWRAELATRSAIVVLDNAADAAQVQPLLPGSSQCLTLITSRRRLVELDISHMLSLDVLTPDDALTLFTKIAGVDRVTAEIDASRGVVELCGCLPLAIRIAGARLRTRSAWTVAHLADRLRQAHHRLSELSIGDRSVAAAFTLSYDHLDPAQQRMFRLLGLHPGPHFDAHAAAALAAVTPAEAERLVEGLVDAHLLEAPAPLRYRFHDLIRLHARTTVESEEPEGDRQAALRRIVDYYLHTAYRASRLLDRQHPPIDIGEPADGCTPFPMPDDAAAMAWFGNNHASVLAARSPAEDEGHHTAVWQLAWTLDNFHYRRGHIHENLACWRAGLAAGERLGDLAVQARAHRRLGLTCAHAEQPAEAFEHLSRSLVLSEQVGDLMGQAGAHFVLALAWTQQGDDRRALTHVTEALRLYRELGNSKWEARALSMMGACHTRLGRHNEARNFCESALSLSRERGDHYGIADSLDSLGSIACHTGRHAEGLDLYEQALALWGDLDNTYRQADTLAAIGRAHVDLCQHQQARDAWQRAVALYVSQGRTTDAERTRQYQDAFELRRPPK